MKTLKFILPATVAILFWAGVEGCHSSDPATANAPSTGPAAKAVQLSDKKTFAIIGRTGVPITYSKPEDPEGDVLSQVVRTKLEGMGYQYQASSPDFVVSVAWNQTQKMVQPSPANTQTPEQTAPIVAVEQATLAIGVRDSMTGAILWQSPVSDPVDPKMVSEDQARSLATTILKDFPPAQAAVAAK